MKNHHRLLRLSSYHNRTAEEGISVYEYLYIISILLIHRRFGNDINKIYFANKKLISNTIVLEFRFI